MNDERHNMERVICSTTIFYLVFASLYGAEFAHASGKGLVASTDSQTYARHLVLDSRKIGSTSNVKLVLGQIRKHPANPLFGDTDEVRIYYGGCDGKHNRYRDGYLMLATIRKDRWAGYEASGEGTIDTAAVKCDGPNLYICADVREGGSIRAEVIGAQGLGLNDCTSVSADVSDGKITWYDKDLEELKGSRIKLRFKLNNATIYSFFTH